MSSIFFISAAAAASLPKQPNSAPYTAADVIIHSVSQGFDEDNT